MQVYTALSLLCCRDGGRNMPALPRGGQTPKEEYLFGITLSCVNLRVVSQRGSLRDGLCVIVYSGEVCRNDIVFCR